MREKKVAVQISADNVSLFPSSPFRFEWLPVILSNQAGNLEHTLTAANFVTPSEISNGLMAFSIGSNLLLMTAYL